jgi:hypothetical protein
MIRTRIKTNNATNANITWQRLLAIQEFGHEHQGQIFMKLWLLKKKQLLKAYY